MSYSTPHHDLWWILHLALLDQMLVGVEPIPGIMTNDVLIKKGGGFITKENF